MQANLKLDTHKGNGFSTKVFSVFFIISVLTLVYFNLISDKDLISLVAQFPEFSDSSKRLFVSNYRIAISVALFLIDVILVGPFAFLSYFGDHIKPKRYNEFLNTVSFFDIGILLALVFTLNLASVHIILIGCISDIRLTNGEMYTIIGVNLAFVFSWLLFALIKIYSYSPSQRKELSKYALKL